MALSLLRGGGEGEPEERSRFIVNPAGTRKLTKTEKNPSYCKTCDAPMLYWLVALHHTLDGHDVVP